MTVTLNETQIGILAAAFAVVGLFAIEVWSDHATWTHAHDKQVWCEGFAAAADLAAVPAGTNKDGDPVASVMRCAEDK